MKKLLVVLLLCGCVTKTPLPAVRAPGSVVDVDTAVERMMQILRPQVVALDRDLITFRYEHDFRPNTHKEIEDRETTWAQRFFDTSLETGDDVGPGVFVATDPAITATWGLLDPQLVVFKIKSGSLILGEENFDLTPEQVHEAQDLSDQMACQDDSDRRDRPIHTAQELVGTFRNGRGADCIKIIVQAVRNLGIQAIAYSFSSASLPDCRATGTAFNIIDTHAVATDEINWYSETRIFEGSSQLTPLVKTLFDQSKDDMEAQSSLASLDMWAKYKKAFNYFVSVQPVEHHAFEAWKAEHIFKCGPRWAGEYPSNIYIILNNVRVHADRSLSNLMIRTSLAYNQRFGGEKNASAQFGPSSFELQGMRAFEKAMFKATGLPANRFAKWLSAEKNPKPSRFAELARLFREHNKIISPNVFEDIALKLNTIPKSEYDAPNLLPVLVGRLGLGPKTALSVYNGVAAVAGFFPRFEGDLPTDLHEPDPYASLNHYLIREMLQKCEAIYLNQKLTLKQIHEGECGLEFQI